jgi:multiple sugar transport system substrate-binding protein
MKMLSIRGIVLWSALAICACKAGPGSTSSMPKVTVRLWTSPLLSELRDYEIYHKFAAEFMELHPEIKIEVEMIPWGKRMQKMITAVNGNNAPDAAYMALDFMPRLTQLGILAPLNKYLSAEEINDYDPVAREGVTVDGQMRLLPMDRSVVCALYNKDLFKKAGLDPEKPPQTWDDVREVADKITSDTNGDGRIDQWGVGYIFGGESTNLSFWPLLWQAGGEVLSADRKQVAFNGEAGVHALTFLTNLYQRGAIPPSFMGVDNQEFARGTVGYWWGTWPILLVQLRADAPKLHLGVGPVLKDKRQLSYSTIASYGLFSSSKHPLETMLFLRFLTRPDNMRRFCREIYRIPTKKSGGPLYSDDPQLAEFERQAQFCRPDVKEVHIREIMATLVPQIQASALGQKTPKQALDDAARICNDIIRRKP